ncbi:MAG: FAD-dependent monooxygenase [Promethearchaeota archaeon]
MKRKMIGTKENPYEVIISGAGPAGLTAGILCGRHRMSTIIFEKEERPSPFPRGETLHAARIFTEVLGSNILNMLSKHLTAARKFNSPNVENNFEIFRDSPSIVYEWDNFIDLLINRVKETETEIRCNAEVLYPLIEKNICVGVQLKSGEKIYGKTVMACDGHSSNIGRTMGVPYEVIQCPVVKRKVSDFKGEYKGFEYFFIAAGMLEYASKFPPAIIFVFPRGDDECEIGMMVFTPEALQLRDYCEMPDEAELTRVWHKLLESYPRFSDLLKDTVNEFEGVSSINTGALHENVIPRPGLMLIGGAIGYVEASGASGIASSMRMAKYASDFVVQHDNIHWTKSLAKHYSKGLKKTKDYKHIKKTYNLYRTGLKWLFVKMRTAEEINKRWNVIKSVYKIA